MNQYHGGRSDNHVDIVTPQTRDSLRKAMQARVRETCAAPDAHEGERLSDPPLHPAADC